MMAGVDRGGRNYYSEHRENRDHQMAQHRMTEHRMNEARLAEQRLAQQRMMEERMGEQGSHHHHHYSTTSYREHQRMSDYRAAELRLGEHRLNEQRFSEHRLSSTTPDDHRVRDWRVPEQQRSAAPVAPLSVVDTETAPPDVEVPERQHRELRPTPQLVAEVYRMAGRSFSQLSELTAQLGRSQNGDKGGVKWSNEELKLLRDALLRLSDSIDTISDNIKARTVEQIKDMIRRENAAKANDPTTPTKKGRPRKKKGSQRQKSPSNDNELELSTSMVLDTN